MVNQDSISTTKNRLLKLNWITLRYMTTTGNRAALTLTSAMISTHWIQGGERVIYNLWTPNTSQRMSTLKMASLSWKSRKNKIMTGLDLIKIVMTILTQAPIRALMIILMMDKTFMSFLHHKVEPLIVLLRKLPECLSLWFGNNWSNSARAWVITFSDLVKYMIRTSWI